MKFLLFLLAILALTATGLTGYFAGSRGGAAVERAKWEQAATKASEQARQIEQERFRASEIAHENYRAELAKVRTAGNRARSELGRLRDVLAARDRAAAEVAAASGRTDDAAPERDVLGSCSEALRGMAEEADGLAARLRGLQGYVASVVRP